MHNFDTNVYSRTSFPLLLCIQFRVFLNGRGRSVAVSQSPKYQKQYPRTKLLQLYLSCSKIVLTPGSWYRRRPKTIPFQDSVLNFSLPQNTDTLPRISGIIPQNKESPHWNLMQDHGSADIPRARTQSVTQESRTWRCFGKRNSFLKFHYKLIKIDKSFPKVERSSKFLTEKIIADDASKSSPLSYLIIYFVVNERPKRCIREYIWKGRRHISFDIIISW